MRLGWPILLCGALGCKGPEEPELVEVICTTDAAQLATGDRVKAIEEKCGEVLLTDFRVLGEGAFTVELYTDGGRVIPGLRSQEDGAVVRGLHMQGHVELDGDGPIRWWRNGWGAGGPSGAVLPASVEIGADQLPIIGGAPGGGAETQSGSWWAGLVGRSGGPAALIGVHAARVLPFAVSYDADGSVHAVWGGGDEEIAADDGEIVFLDPLFLAVGPDPVRLWETYADAVAAENLVSLSASTPPVVWLADADQLDEASVLAATEALVALDGDLTVESPGVVAIGEGWQDAVGEWVAGPAFPAGMPALATAIADAGKVPGLWLAPLVVDPGAPVHAANPEWWVVDRDGVELEHSGRAVLDVTQPDAAAWLAAEVERLVDDGWRVLHLAELGAGARQGERSSGVPSTTAYRMALEQIAAAAGPGVRIVALDGPLLPTVGLVDSYPAGPAGGSVAEQARALGARSFSQSRWWTLGSAPILAADPDSAALGVAVAAGGAWTVRGEVAGAGALPGLGVDVVAGRGARAVPDAAIDTVAESLDGGPAPTVWPRDDGTTVLLNASEVEALVDGPGGTELVSGTTADPGPRTLAPASAEVWR